MPNVGSEGSELRYTEVPAGTETTGHSAHSYKSGLPSSPDPGDFQDLTSQKCVGIAAGFLVVAEAARTRNPPFYPLRWP